MKKKGLPFFLTPMITLGAVCLANPVFGVVDVIPDVIGCILLWFGLTELSYTDSRIETARLRLLYLAGLEGIKMALTPGILRSGVTSDTLAATTVFGAVEALLLVLILNDLYSGVTYTALRKGSGDSLSALEDAKTLAFVFIGIRVGLTIVPELAAIFEQAAHDDITNAELYLRIAGLENYFHLFNFIITTIVGIWWCINFCGVFKALKRDSLFTENLARSYENGYTGNVRTRISTWIKHASRIMMLGLVFFFNMDLTTYSISGNILPNFIGTAFILLSVCAMGHPIKAKLYKKFSWITVLFSFGVQIFAYVYRKNYINLNDRFWLELEWQNVLVCSAIALLEFASFMLLSVMCENIFKDYVTRVCGEKTAGLMYSWQIATAISGILYVVSYAFPVLRGFLAIPQVAALIALGAIINANANFVRGSVENPEEELNICADL